MIINLSVSFIKFDELDILREEVIQRKNHSHVFSEYEWRNKDGSIIKVCNMKDDDLMKEIKRIKQFRELNKDYDKTDWTNNQNVKEEKINYSELFGL